MSYTYSAVRRLDFTAGEFARAQKNPNVFFQRIAALARIFVSPTPVPWLRATPTAARPERSIVLLSNKGEEEEEGGEPRGEASTQVPSLPVPRGQSCSRVGNRPFPTNALHHSYGNENGQHSFLGGNEFCLDEAKNYRLWREWKAKEG